MGAAVVGHERPDVGADVERVRVRRVEHDRVDRRVRQVAGDVGPALAAVERPEDVPRPARRRGVVARVGQVGDPVVAPVDGDRGHRPLGQLAVLEPRPGRRRRRLGLRAQVHEPVERAGVDGVAAADADRGDRAVPRPVRRGSGAAARQVGADRLPQHLAGRRRLGVVGPVEPLRPEEELVRVVPVQHPRRVEVRAVAEVDPVPDVGVAEEDGAAVRRAVRRDPVVAAVDVVVVGRVDEHLAAVAAVEVVPGLRRTRPPCRCPGCRPRSGSEASGWSRCS